jgi:hypothetical protein
VSPGFQSFFTSSLIFFFLLFLFSILGEVGLCLLTRFFVVVEAQWTQIVIQVLILSSERDQDRDCQVVGRNVEQCCIFRFGTRFGLAIRMKYFDTGQYRRSVSGLPQIYIYIYKLYII